MRILILFALALPITAQRISVPCEAPVATLRLLEPLPPIGDFGIPYEQRIGALRKLAADNPGDFFVQRAYQDSFRRQFYLGNEYDRALKIYRERISDPLSRYYEARLLMNVEPKKSRATFEAFLKDTPKFVWPYLDFLDWASLPGQRNAAQVAEHWKTFLAVCPAPLDSHFDTALVNDKDLLSRMASDLRQALERRNTRLDWERLPEIWNIEERAGVTRESLQAHVRSDLKRISDAPLWSTPALLQISREATRILGEDHFTAQLSERIKREAPNSTLAYDLAKSEWSRQNPAPGPEADLAALPRYQRKMEEAQLEWARQWPNSPSAIAAQWRKVNLSLMNGRSAALSQADLTVIDRAVAWTASSPDAMGMWPPIQTEVARMYVAARVRLDQVPRLLDGGYTQIEKQEKYRASHDFDPAELQVRAMDQRKFTWEQSQQIRADYLLATNRPADGRAIIETALSQLDKAPRGDPTLGRVDYDRREWLRRLGKADALEGKVENALSHYEESLTGFSRETLQRTSSRWTVADIKKYYLAHGGSEDKWLDWGTAKLAFKPPAVTEAPFIAALPVFAGKDLTGRTWTLEDFKGKITFINFWATWCGPCRGEHPALQELFNRVRTVANTQVLTISVDEDPGAVANYLKEMKYTFPVIQSQELADKLMPYVSLPTNFFVNQSGLRTSMYPFGGDAVSIERVLKQFTSTGR